MARLDPTKRANLPNSAFAYVDARGRRRLPIHDEAHVRNALARFNQVAFEDEAARDLARTRLLKAAKRFGIVPVGFVTGQLRTEREAGSRRAREPLHLPSGFVTMLMTDIEGSTALVQRLGDRFRELIADVWRILGDTAEGMGGHVAEARADEFFAAFELAGPAVATAVEMQRALQRRLWFDDVGVRVRIGIHSGSPTRAAPNYIGVAVNTSARVCGSAHGGQIILSEATRAAARGSMPDGVRLRGLGEFRLRGLAEPVTLYQVLARGLPAKFPPLRAYGRA